MDLYLSVNSLIEDEFSLFRFVKQSASEKWAQESNHSFKPLIVWTKRFESNNVMILINSKSVMFF